jgi:hypothetical protein
VITWKDFILDDQFGPQLVIEVSNDELIVAKTCRRTWTGKDSSVMEDARGLAVNVPIQETGQEQRPARMVGSSGLESHTRAAGADAGKEAGQVSASASYVQREGTS